MTVKNKRKQDQRNKPEVGAKLNALPVTFKFAAETLKLMSQRGGSAGSIVVSKYKSYNYKLIYALVMNTLKHIKIIKKIIHESKLMKKVPEQDSFLLEILVGDLLYGKGLKSVEQNSTATAVIKHKDDLLKQRDLLKKSADFADTQDSTIEAKYLRINHLKTSMEHVLSQLKTVGLQQLDYERSKIKYKKFINKFKSMENNQFMVDFHFPDDLIILKPTGAQKLKKTDLLSKGKVMVQDKASYMAVEALEVKPNQKIIDACCAPGGKTTLIATKMKNKGKILAYDVDKKRLLSAIHMLKVNGVTCAKTEVQDFSKVKLQRLPKLNNIEAFDSILIDPSCSGSGIKKRMDYNKSNEEAGRLKKLQAFQVAMLKHALKANISKCIVYCTCSTSVEENEQVVEMALNESGVKHLWDVVDVLPYWMQRGEANYEFGPKCLRSDEESLTNGFFIAKLVRNNTPASAKSSSKETSGDEPGPKAKKQKLAPKVADVNEDDDENDDDAGEDEEEEDQEDDEDDQEIEGEEEDDEEDGDEEEDEEEEDDEEEDEDEEDDDDEDDEDE